MPIIQNILYLLLFTLSAAAFSQSTPEIIQGRVVAIADGDTATILMNNQQYRIRLAEIDTPERGQPYSSRAREALSELIFGKEVMARVQEMDRYDRYVATIYVDGLDVNREMVRLGAAWVYRQYLRDRSLLQVEQEAREAGRGLWSLPESQNISPWKWRSQIRSGNQEDKDCGDFTTWQQAQSFFELAGHSDPHRLDGDGDGIACETLK